MTLGPVPVDHADGPLTVVTQNPGVTIRRSPHRPDGAAAELAAVTRVLQAIARMPPDRAWRYVQSLAVILGASPGARIEHAPGDPPERRLSQG